MQPPSAELRVVRRPELQPDDDDHRRHRDQKRVLQRPRCRRREPTGGRNAAAGSADRSASRREVPLRSPGAHRRARCYHARRLGTRRETRWPARSSQTRDSASRCRAARAGRAVAVGAGGVGAREGVAEAGHCPAASPRPAPAAPARTARRSTERSISRRARTGNRYVSSNAQTRWRSSTATGSRGVGSEAGYGRLRVGERQGGACRHATALSGAHRLAASPDGMNVYVATGVSNAVAVFDRDSVTGALT